jgi:2-dehydropantoate 2-reductase
MTQDPAVRTLIRAIMEEIEGVGRAIGMETDIPIDKRLEAAARVGAFKTSMLQDLEAGKPLELEPIVGAVVELADRLGVPIPHTRTIYASTRLLEKVVVRASV